MKDIPLAPPWALLDEVVAFVRRYCVLTDAQAAVIGLWILHTHVFEAAETTPYLAVTSAEKQSGKTRVLEVLNLLTHAPWKVTSPSSAVFFRKIERDKPTILLDEVDAIFNQKAEDYQEIRGAINAGFQYGGTTARCEMKGKNIELRDFNVYCPKALAGIGTLPDTISDRSIQIRIKRKSKAEQIERFRFKKVRGVGAELRGRIEAWAEAAGTILEEAEPLQPAGLSDRMEDACEPLLAIADLLGGIWPEKARAAIVELCTTEVALDASIGVKMLLDVREIFRWKGSPIFTPDIVQCLKAEDESPWAGWSHGKGITPSDLARLLKPYDVRPKTVRIGGATAKGYKSSDFEDAFSRLLPEPSEAVTKCGETPVPF